MPRNDFGWFISVIMFPAAFSCAAWLLKTVAMDFFPFPLRVLLFFCLDGAYGSMFGSLLLPFARFVARRCPGAVVPASETDLVKQEREQHDFTLAWPPPGSALPPDWVEAAGKPGGRDVKNGAGSQPYFLNHVRGSTRCRQAAHRVGQALGTMICVALMSRWIDDVPVSDLGLDLRFVDLAWGFLVGSAIVIALFLSEVWLFGWLRVIGIYEVVVPGESIGINLLWDVLFHLGVSVNEEVSMRGWLLVHVARWVSSTWAFDTGIAMVLSVALQASLFSLAHLGSPGASRVGLVNLIVGGAAAAANVFVSGGLSFGLGWHFGWNIFMGHLLGMSTSGIPMSAKLVSVVPHPQKSRLHGGRFGPEQSPLAPFAYLLGCAALLAIYGTAGIDVWQERIATASH